MIERATLPRAEWDFSGCPPEQLWRCWSYEYGRHVQWLKDAHKAGAGPFDEHGNWYRSREIGEPDEDDYEQISFCILPGFPDMPFLEALSKARFPEYPKTGTESVRAVSGTSRPSSIEQLHRVAIKWHESDEKILRDFIPVLKKMRPSPPFNRRGGSERRRYEADLKALGAYRLLTSGMTARRAIEYTGQKLYKQESEWFTAKRRAASIIKKITTLAPMR